MPSTLRRLLAAGIVLTLTGLLGLAATAGDPGASRGVVRYVFVPMYAVGALLLVGVGARWLMVYTKRRGSGDG